MIAKCMECGKKFDILWPHLWKYKRKGQWLCSYGCMRAYDRKEAEDMENMKKDGTPKKKPGRKPAVVETPEDGFTKEELNQIKEGKIPLTEPQKKLIKLHKYTVTGIRTEDFGEFYFDQKFNSIDWRTIEGDEVSLSPIGWKNLMEEMPDILRALGVE